MAEHMAVTPLMLHDPSELRRKKRVCKARGTWGKRGAVAGVGERGRAVREAGVGTVARLKRGPKIRWALCGRYAHVRVRPKSGRSLAPLNCL